LAIESNSHLFDDWFDPIENMIRGQVRGLIEEMIRGELDATLSRPRYARRPEHSEGRDLTVVTSHRHGSRVRSSRAHSGIPRSAVPRLNISRGKTTERKELAQLSQLGEKSERYQYRHSESFHYTALAGRRAIFSGAVIRGGG
jgi:hypothetical protein